MGDPETFAREVWTQGPQHRPASVASGFADLLSLDDVDLIVSTSGLRLPAFRLVKGGETLPPARYTKTTRTGSQQAPGVIDSRAVFDEFDGGATIVFQSMHRYWPPLSDYCRGLELALGHPVQANAYITPPGAQGFGSHEDEHDVFVLQSEGTKQWQVHGLHDLPATKPPVIDALLAPGDSLYIPAGFPHSASTQAEASVHITIGILAVTWAALLKEAVKEIESDPTLREPLPLGFAADVTFDEEVTRRLKELSAAMAEIDPSDMARRLRLKVFTTRQPLLRGQMGRLMTLDALGDDTVVARRTGSVCVLEILGDELSVLLGDRELRMPSRVSPAMEVIATGDRVSVADLPGLDMDGRLTLVRRLIREGLLEVIP